MIEIAVDCVQCPETAARLVADITQSVGAQLPRGWKALYRQDGGYDALCPKHAGMIQYRDQRRRRPVGAPPYFDPMLGDAD